MWIQTSKFTIQLLTYYKRKNCPESADCKEHENLSFPEERRSSQERLPRESITWKEKDEQNFFFNFYSEKTKEKIPNQENTKV